MVISTFGLLGIATVDDGEGIPVANTPPHPPPLPDPPISISDNINNGYEYSVTSTDGERLLFRLMYRVQVPNDKAMNILHDEKMKEYYTDTAITQLQLVVLYQVKYEMIRPLQFLYHYDDDMNMIKDPDDNTRLISLIVLFRLKYRVEGKVIEMIIILLLTMKMI
jgi:hypothetical protein